MTIDLRNEVWADIPYFPEYQISNLGRVYNNRTDKMMSVSRNNHGHMKVSLLDWTGTRHTMALGFMVADAFVPKLNEMCDSVVVVDGDFTNIVAHNLAWRPRRFAYLYTRQLKIEQPIHFQNLPILNVSKGVLYNSIIEAGMSEVLLFDDIWRCTYTHLPALLTGDYFEIPHDE